MSGKISLDVQGKKKKKKKEMLFLFFFFLLKSQPIILTLWDFLNVKHISNFLDFM